MNGRTVLMLLVGVVSVVLAAGCEPQRLLVPDDKGLIADVPVPTTFKFDPAHSSGFTSHETGEQYSNYHYNGRAFFADVETFYKREMPAWRWRLQNDVSSAGRKTLCFRKTGTAPERTDVPTCVVTIFARDEYATAIQIVRTEK